MKSELLKFYSGDLNLKRIVSEVYRTFLMLPFHSSIHLSESVQVVQTDISHGTLSSSHEFGIVFGDQLSPGVHSTSEILHFPFKRHITLSYRD